MRTILRSIFFIAMATVFAAAVFAHGQREGTSATAPSHKTKISFWFYPIEINVPGYANKSQSYGDFEKYMAAQFEQTHPNIKVETQLLPWNSGPQKINVSIAGGDPPNIVLDYLGRTAAWFDQGAAVPLGNILPKSLQNQILPSFRSLYMIHGKLSALPLMAWSMEMMVNKALTDKYHVSQYLPKPGQGWTHAQFVKALEAMKASPASKAGIYPYAKGAGNEQGDYLWWESMWSFGAHLYNANGGIVSSSPQMVAGYKWLLSLQKRGLMTPGTASRTELGVLKLWNAEKVFMIGGDAGEEAQLAAAVKQGSVPGPVDVIAVPFPTSHGVKPKTALGPTGFVIMTRNPAKQKAAATFIDYYVTKYGVPAVKAAGQFPALSSIANQNIYQGDPLMASMSKLIRSQSAGNFALTDPHYGKLRVALSAAEQAIFSGEESPQQAVTAFLAKAHQIEAGS